MCAPKPPKDKSAKIARKQEEERQARIREGRASIDKAFSQFDDAHYARLEAAWRNNYLPQLEDQYDDTRRDLVFGLARQGILAGSAGARQLGRLEETYQTNRTAIGDQARGAAQEARGAVEQNRGDLISQLSATSDASAAAATAAARASTLVPAPVYDPLPDVFGAFRAALPAVTRGDFSGSATAQPLNFSQPRGGSARVVGGR
jgi:hypothetical protein